MLAIFSWICCRNTSRQRRNLFLRDSSTSLSDCSRWPDSPYGCCPYCAYMWFLGNCNRTSRNNSTSIRCFEDNGGLAFRVLIRVVCMVCSPVQHITNGWLPGRNNNFLPLRIQIQVWFCPFCNLGNFVLERSFRIPSFKRISSTACICQRNGFRTVKYRWVRLRIYPAVQPALNIFAICAQSVSPQTAVVVSLPTCTIPTSVPAAMIVFKISLVKIPTAVAFCSAV